MQKLLVTAMLLATGGAIASQQPVPQLLVRLKPVAESGRESPQAARERLQSVARAAGVAMQADRAVGTQHRLLRLPAPQAGAELDDTLRRLRLHPDVLDVEPDVRIQRLAVPNDPGYAQYQWHLQSSADYPAAMNLPAAWDRSTGSAQGVVAVLDVGVRLSHPDLAGRLLPGYDFVSEVEFANDGDGRDANPDDPGDWVSRQDLLDSSVFSGCEIEDSSWHGTFIAGQVGAATNNAAGVAGIDWQGKVLPVRIAGKCGARLSDLLDGMRWAAGLPVDGAPPNPHPARVLNLSFGGDAPCTPSYQQVIDEITAAGALLVVAAGNSATAPARPADCRGVMAVAAVQYDGRKADYSNYGASVALSAPGGSYPLGIYSLDNSGTTVPLADTYGAKAGTSFASPQAAGVAALMLAVNPQLSPAQLIARMQASARPHTLVAGWPSCQTSAGACNCDTSTCGAGLLDAAAALEQALPALPLARILGPVAARAGETLSLDGSASTPGSGASITVWQWRQTGGPAAASLATPNAPQTTVALPQQPGSYVFELAVSDSAGRVDVDERVVVVSAPSGGAGDGEGGDGEGGGGGGASGWAWGAGLWLLALAAWRRRCG